MHWLAWNLICSALASTSRGYDKAHGMMVGTCDFSLLRRYVAGVTAFSTRRLPGQVWDAMMSDAETWIHGKARATAYIALYCGTVVFPRRNDEIAQAVHLAPSRHWRRTPRRWRYGGVLCSAQLPHM